MKKKKKKGKKNGEYHLCYRNIHLGYLSLLTQL